MAIPEVRIFKAGKLEKRIVGLSPKEAYTDVLDGLLTATVGKEQPSGTRQAGS